LDASITKRAGIYFIILHCIKILISQKCPISLQLNQKHRGMFCTDLIPFKINLHVRRICRFKNS
jgi:hypothetical protein